jgi:hypothetical protein
LVWVPVPLKILFCSTYFTSGRAAIALACAALMCAEKPFSARL